MLSCIQFNTTYLVLIIFFPSFCWVYFLRIQLKKCLTKKLANELVMSSIELKSDKI